MCRAAQLIFCVPKPPDQAILKNEGYCTGCGERGDSQGEMKAEILILKDIPAFATVTLLTYEDIMQQYEVPPRTQMLLNKDEEVPQYDYVAKYQRDKTQHFQKMGKYDEVNNREDTTGTREKEEVSLMQRKRRRSPSPRRRRRERAARDNERLRQERRSAWTIRSSRDRVTTETCSRKSLTAPWQRGGSRPSGTSRPQVRRQDLECQMSHH